MWLERPALSGRVELTNERALHVLARHGDGVDVLTTIPEVLAQPDVVLRSMDGRERLFTRLVDVLPTQRHIVVVVVTSGSPTRHWVVTAYSARKLPREGSRWLRE